MQALIFDKDGTLFHFGATWDAWMNQVIADLSRGDDAVAQRIATSVRFDLAGGYFQSDSPVIAGTGEEAAQLIHAAIPDHDFDDLTAYLDHSAANAPLAPATDLNLLLQTLRDQGLRLSVMTNDSERAAKAHISSQGIEGHFDMIAGYDSGYGAKPSPDPLLACAQIMKSDPAQTAMVGDSTHDLMAGRAAGMVTIGVLTGMAQPEDLHAYADVILPDIGHIPRWLSEQSGGQQ